jgi:PleD family two-component response regulator
VAALNLLHSGSSVASHVTLSLGVAAALPEEQELSPAALIERADAALYAAKHAGRNCFVAHDSPKTAAKSTLPGA